MPYKDKDYQNLVTRKLKTIRRQYISAFKSATGCCDCGESDPRCLDFDHRDPNNKIDGISVMVSSGRSMAALEAEILKCDVRCANCHRKLHYLRVV